MTENLEDNCEIKDQFLFKFRICPIVILGIVSCAVSNDGDSRVAYMVFEVRETFPELNSSNPELFACTDICIPAIGEMMEVTPLVPFAYLVSVDVISPVLNKRENAVKSVHVMDLMPTRGSHPDSGSEVWTVNFSPIG